MLQLPAACARAETFILSDRAAASLLSASAARSHFMSDGRFIPAFICSGHSPYNSFQFPHLLPPAFSAANFPLPSRDHPCSSLKEPVVPASVSDGSHFYRSRQLVSRDTSAHFLSPHQGIEVLSDSAQGLPCFSQSLDSGCSQKLINLNQKTQRRHNHHHDRYQQLLILQPQLHQQQLSKHLLNQQKPHLLNQPQCQQNQQPQNSQITLPPVVARTRPTFSLQCNGLEDALSCCSKSIDRQMTLLGRENRLSTDTTSTFDENEGKLDITNHRPSTSCSKRSYTELNDPDCFLSQNSDSAQKTSLQLLYYNSHSGPTDVSSVSETTNRASEAVSSDHSCTKRVCNGLPSSSRHENVRTPTTSPSITLTPQDGRRDLHSTSTHVNGARKLDGTGIPLRDRVLGSSQHISQPVFQHTPERDLVGCFLLSSSSSDCASSSRTASTEVEAVASRNSSQPTTHFVKGSLIRLANGQTKRVEDLRTEDFVKSADFCPQFSIDASRVIRILQKHDCGTAVLAFIVGKKEQQATVEAALDHPFFVFGSGWSSCHPTQTFQRYGLTCKQLNVGDICLSLVKNISVYQTKTAH